MREKKIYIKKSKYTGEENLKKVIQKISPQVNYSDIQNR